MNKKHILFALAVAAFMPHCSCGDHNNNPDAAKHDAVTDGGFPAAPTLGAQIDRLGRPAINTALNHAFDPTAASKGAAKDAYNQDTAIASWPTTYVAGTNNFAFNLALIDAVDYGLSCTNGTCGAGTGGCGNQALYNGNLSGGGTAAATSYDTLATVLADDELYVDTRNGTCSLPSNGGYLAVEFTFAQNPGTAALTCGGRAPSYDVMAVTYTAAAIGIGGFKVSDGSFAAVVGGLTNVAPHGDTSDTTFPFLGPPH